MGAGNDWPNIQTKPKRQVKKPLDPLAWLAVFFIAFSLIGFTPFMMLAAMALGMVIAVRGDINAAVAVIVSALVCACIRVQFLFG